ncbi:aminoacyl-histidine dipeptidase [Myxococcota bacterium]
MREALEGLDPKPLWHYFDMISQIPRCSGNEEQIQAALEKLGKEKGLDTRRDKVGNLVIVIPPTRGCESSPTVVLQGHTDIVGEKNSDSNHDFDNDAIVIVRDGDWLTADGTTLGGDNGVAVAAALALIDDPPKKHGQLELFFTIDEERGLTGAGNVEAHMLNGRVLLNLDSEEEGFVTVGCAGGGDTRFRLVCNRDQLPSGWETMRLWVKGLKGGHSGIDILENRANSIHTLGRLLDRVRREAGGLRLLALNGGSKRNAIPREAWCVVGLPAGGRNRAKALVETVETELKAEFGATDPKLELVLEAAPPDAPIAPFTQQDTDRIVALLVTTPTGVLAMNRDIGGLVDTSTNLGVVEMRDDTLHFVSCTRSALSSARDAVRGSLRVLGESMGASVELEGSYPGWNPNLDSKLLAVFKHVHEKVTGKPPEVMAIHAGLECGILGERFEGMDMISFGPDMDGVHSPDERLSIPSTQRFYDLLKAVLVELA